MGFKLAPSSPRRQVRQELKLLPIFFGALGELGKLGA
jgi:hypothetical protein